MSTTLSGRIGVALALMAIVFLPMLIGGQWMRIFTSTACFTLAAAAAAFMYARLNMVSLAQVALMGVGGWVMLRLNHGTALPFEINLLLTGVLTAAISVLLALPALRMRGLYLALITLMIAGGLEVIFSTYRFPNGGTGFWGVMPSAAAPFRRPVLAESDGAYLRYVIAVVLIGFLLIDLHRRTRPGRAWAMIRRSEAAALASGVNVTAFKAWAFALSGLLAGLAGGLLAGALGLLDPATFRASESVLLFALSVVGGAQYWFGAVIAAMLYRVLPAVFNNAGIDPNLTLVIFGAALLHAITTAPDGIAGQIMGVLRRITAWLRPRGQ